MTPALLSKIKDLVEAGATVITPTRPRKSPGLTDYPACDSRYSDSRCRFGVTDRPRQDSRNDRSVADTSIWGGALTPPPPSESDQIPELTAAKWIWHREGNPAAAAPPGTRYFRRVIALEHDKALASAKLLMAADNSFECWVNGRQVGAGDNFTQAYLMDIKPALKPGTNVIAVAAKNGADVPNPAGLIGQLVIRLQDGGSSTILTDSSWEANASATGDWDYCDSNGRLASGDGIGAVRHGSVG